jgi:hypothetical protein
MDTNRQESRCLNPSDAVSQHSEASPRSSESEEISSPATVFGNYYGAMSRLEGNNTSPFPASDSEQVSANDTLADCQSLMYPWQQPHATENPIPGMEVAHENEVTVRRPFRFLDLPAEIRLRVYSYIILIANKVVYRLDLRLMRTHRHFVTEQKLQYINITGN